MASGGWPDQGVLRSTWTELDRAGLLGRPGPSGLQPTYLGLVWETRRGFTLDSQHIDELVAEWETTNVDFKRELNLSSNDEKAEFVKDVLGLATTKSSGRRWLIIGFHPKTREYYAPPDPSITPDRIEQILSEYTDPVVLMRYDTPQTRHGVVGRLEVLRSPADVPYRVKKELRGAKRHIRPGQVFVRHGSQTVEAPPGEEQRLLEEPSRETGA